MHLSTVESHPKACLPAWPHARFLRAPVGADLVYPNHKAGIPEGLLTSGNYDVRFAQNLRDLRSVQRLRLEVFRRELTEVCSDSFDTGFDQDLIDGRSHHLMVIERQSGDLVGTYRLMSHELAQREELSSYAQFDLTGLPDHLLREGVELGRACVAKEHRSGRVLELLWRGIARYVDWNEKRFVLGRCSVPTVRVETIAAFSLELARSGHFHPDHFAPVRRHLTAEQPERLLLDQGLVLPPLFASYIRLGAKVCGGPALDRESGVTDYLVVLDLKSVDPRALSSVRGGGALALRPGLVPRPRRNDLDRRGSGVEVECGATQDMLSHIQVAARSRSAAETAEAGHDVAVEALVWPLTKSKI